MKLRDASLQVYKKHSFTHPPSWILSSFFQNASRLPLPKRLWRFACLITVHLCQASSCWKRHLMFSWVQFLSNKLEFFVSCNTTKVLKDHNNILLFAQLVCVLICTYLLIIFFNTIMISVSNPYFRQQSQRWRNDISFDVWATL